MAAAAPQVIPLPTAATDAFLATPLALRGMTAREIITGVRRVR